MDLESIRDYCLSLPYATEDMAFGPDYVNFRVCGRIFACLGFERPDYLSVKCDPERALELREEYADIEPAWHWNKKYWNQLRLTGSLREELIKELIRHSYSEAAAKLTRKVKAEYPDIATVS